MTADMIANVYANKFNLELLFYLKSLNSFSFIDLT
jgi:hypothetical protein